MKKKRFSVGILVLALAVSLALAASGCNEQQKPPLSIGRTEYTYAGSSLSVEVGNLETSTVESLRMEGKAVNPSNYTVGRTLILKTAFLDTLDAGTFGFVLAADTGIVSFSVTVPESEPAIKAPVVSPGTRSEDVSSLAEDLRFSISYNGGSFTGLTRDGLPLDESDYRIRAATLWLTRDYLSGLGPGTFSFLFETDGGTCGFEVTLTYQKLWSSDEPLKLFSGSDVRVNVMGGAGRELTLTLNGAELDSSAWEYAGDVLTVGSAALSELQKEVYSLSLSAPDAGSVSFYIAKGMRRDEVFLADFDKLEAPGLGFGQDLTIGVTPEGTDGQGMRVETPSQGTLLNFGPGNIDYGFSPGKAYALSFDFRPNSIISGTSSFQDIFLPFWFTREGGKDNLCYVCYNEEDGFYLRTDSAARYASLRRTGDFYSVYVEFEYQSSYQNLEVASWMKSDIVCDNIKLIPADGRLNAQAETDIQVPFGKTDDVVIDLGDVDILGAAIDGEPAGSNFSRIAGKAIFAGSWLASLPKNSVHPFEIATSKGRVAGSIEISAFDITVEGESFRYAADGQPLTFSVRAEGLTLLRVLADGAAVPQGDYSLAGGTLTLRSGLLDRIMSRAVIRLEFDRGASKEFELTSKRQIFFDYDGFDRPRTGYGLGTAQSVVENGIDGRSGRLTNNQSATLLTLGGDFLPAEFAEGKVYELSMKFRIDEIDENTNFIVPESKTFIPIYFRSGMDVAYLVYENGGCRLSVQDRGTNGSLTKDENGVYTFRIEMRPGADCTKLSIDIWMPCTLVVDDFSVVEL